jgi:hypothetical protein
MLAQEKRNKQKKNKKTESSPAFLKVNYSHLCKPTPTFSAMNSFSDAPQSTCDTKILLTYNVILTRSK